MVFDDRIQQRALFFGRAGDTVTVLRLWAHDTKRQRAQPRSRLRAKTSERAREAKEMVFERNHSTPCSVKAIYEPTIHSKTPSLCALLVQEVLLLENRGVKRLATFWCAFAAVLSTCPNEVNLPCLQERQPHEWSSQGQLLCLNQRLPVDAPGGHLWPRFPCQLNCVL